jgi:hypothetical protein
MNHLKSALLTGSIAFFTLAGADAATVSAAGTLANLTPVGNAVGTDIADLDGAGVGTDGFIIFNTLPEGGNVSGAAWNANIVDNSPAYITALDGSVSVSSGGWANYDDVTVGGNTYNTGGINRGSGLGVELASFSFQLTGTVPSTVTIGLLTDNSDGVGWASNNVRIEGPGAISANQSITPDGGSDLIQFDINGGASGETYTIFGTSNGNGSLFGAATFDSIPEPGAMALFAVGIALIFRRRGRR